MNADHFSEVLEGTFGRIRQILDNKAQEYADDVDRLRNFKQAAHLKETTPIKALSGMLAKHTVSVYDMMEADTEFTLDVWDEKIIDHLNYLILLRALVIEKKMDDEAKQTTTAVEGLPHA